MKLFFYANTDCGLAANGVSKKVLAQIKAMRKLGFEVWYTSYTKHGMEIYNNHDEVVFEKESRIPLRLFRYVRREYLITGVTYYLKKFQTRFDFFYLRFHFFDYKYWKMLESMKRQGYVIVEAHGYPYREFGSWRSNYVIIRDILFEKKCARNIDCVAAISKEPLIWNCKTVSIDNAVNMEDVPIKAPRKGKGDELVLISVAVEQPYHAYYRLINGIGRYYENGGGRNIKLYMVGKYRDQTQQLVCSWKLQDHIFFVGEKSGRELDLLFDKADIAVGTFGKRGGSEFGSSIKSKEYFARGIPFINGWREYAFDDDCPYVLRFPLDDTDIDIHKVLAFYDALRERSDVSVKMREFAEQNFTWEGQYEKLFGEIFEGTGFFCDSSLQKS